MNIGNGNEFSRILIFCQFWRFHAEKVKKIRIYATGIHKIIHKNEINDYSSAFRTQSYTLMLLKTTIILQFIAVLLLDLLVGSRDGTVTVLTSFGDIKASFYTNE